MRTPSYLVWCRRQNLRHGHYKYLQVYKWNFYTKSIFIIEHNSFERTFPNYFGTSIVLRVQIKDVITQYFIYLWGFKYFFLCQVLINNKHAFLSATTSLSCFESWKHIYTRASHLHSLKHETLYFQYFTESHSKCTLYLYALVSVRFWQIHCLCRFFTSLVTTTIT